MALYTNLPVYKLGYDLLIQIYKQTKLFARDYRYTIGEKLKNETLELLLNIYKSNKSNESDRIQYIDIARQNIELVKILIRITKDLNVITLKNYSYLSEQTEELSKQLSAWRKFTAGAANKKSKT